MGRSSTRYSPVRRSTQGPKPPFSHDLHVLSTPPAFNLSQDQTLQFEILVLLKPNRLNVEWAWLVQNHPTRYLIVKDPCAALFSFARTVLVTRPAARRQRLFSFADHFFNPAPLSLSAGRGNLVARRLRVNSFFSITVDFFRPAVPFPVRSEREGLTTASRLFRQQLFSITVDFFPPRSGRLRPVRGGRG